jgi:bla regulator protein blaR1
MIKLIFFSTINWALFLLLYQFLLRREKYFLYNRIYLLLATFLGFMVPILSQMRIFSFENQINKNLNFSINLPELLISEKNNFFSQNNIFYKILWIVYFAVIIVLAFKLLNSLFKIKRFYKHGKKTNTQKYKLIYVEQNNIAFSFFSYIFISDNCDQEREKIFKHELTHAKQGHSYDIMFMEIIKIIFWFNPLVYIFDYLIKENHEYIADQAVIDKYPRKSYSEFLINQMQSGMQLVITNNFINSLIKNRIKMMYKTEKRNRWKYFLAVSLILTLITLAPDINAQVKPVKKGEKIYEKVDEMPRFPGCEKEISLIEKDNCSQQKLMQYIFSNLKYPEKAVENGIEGIAVIKFLVTKKGQISNVEILKDPGNDCGKAAKQVVENMNNMTEKWIPGKIKGKKANVTFTLPVKFKLQGDSKKE